MTEVTEHALDGAGGEAVHPEAEQVEAAEAPESTEGQVDTDMPAEDEAKAKAEEEERKTRNQRRKEAKLRAQQELTSAKAAAEAAQKELEKVRSAVEGMKPPQEKDFQSFDAYQAALASHATIRAMDQRRVAELEAAAKSHFDEVEAKKQADMQEDAQNWAAQVEDGRRKYPDFDQVALNQAPIHSQDAARLLVQSDHAADIAYMIGSNPEVRQQFEQLQGSNDLMGIARLFGRLEAQVTAPKPKTATDAPDPISPIRPKASAGKDPAKMTPDEYRKWREGK